MPHPTEALLLSIARVGDDDAAALARRRGVIDPAHLIDEAAAHGVLNLLIATVAEHPGCWPELEHRLAEVRPGLVAWAARTALELGELVTTLETNGIAYAVVKGPVLAAHAYGDLHARGFSDIDVLVNRNDVRAALAALDRNDVIGDYQAAVAEGAGQVHVRLPRGTSLDLHWELINDPHVRRDFTLETAELLSRARHVDVAGTPVATLDAVDTLLHLCSHAAVSGGHRLGWYVDLDRTARRDQLNHDDLLARANATGLALTTDILMARAADQLGTPGYRPLVPATAPARIWQLVGRPVQRVPLSRAEHDGHRGQLYFRSTRATLGASTREAARFAAIKLRSKLRAS